MIGVPGVGGASCRCVSEKKGLLLMKFLTVLLYTGLSRFYVPARSTKTGLTLVISLYLYAVEFNVISVQY